MPRKPERVAANIADPLRAWDGREHISRRRVPQGIAAIGRAFGAAFNALDSRSRFIETVEREEPFDALDFLADEAQTAVGRDLSAARAALIEGVDSSRDW